MEIIFEEKKLSLQNKIRIELKLKLSLISL